MDALTGAGVPESDIDFTFRPYAEGRMQAVADARQQADIQADLPDISVGELHASRDLPSVEASVSFWYGPVPLVGGCAPFGLPVNLLAPYALPPFDPTQEAVVTANAQIEPTFVVTAGATATPTD